MLQVKDKGLAHFTQLKIISLFDEINKVLTAMSLNSSTKMTFKNANKAINKAIESANNEISDHACQIYKKTAYESKVNTEVYLMQKLVKTVVSRLF